MNRVILSSALKHSILEGGRKFTQSQKTNKIYEAQEAWKVTGFPRLLPKFIKHWTTVGMKDSSLQHFIKSSPMLGWDVSL